MANFIGRHRELSALAQVLGEVRGDLATERPGRCLVVRGRRRIGKSALIEAFVDAAKVPYVYYTAELGAGADALGEFSSSVLTSNVADAAVFGDAAPGNW